jgi:hypothetical protein
MSLRDEDDARLIDALAMRILRWKPRRDRFMTSGRDWISKTRFQPLNDIKDAFRLLELVTDDFTLLSAHRGPFVAEVRLRGRIGRAAGTKKARTITLAIARLIGLEAEPDSPQRGQRDGL